MRELNSAELVSAAGGIIQIPGVDDTDDMLGSGSGQNGLWGDLGALNAQDTTTGSFAGVGQLVGAVTGAVVCFGTPLVPFCAAVGAFIGANVPTSSSPTGGMISDIVAP